MVTNKVNDLVKSKYNSNKSADSNELIEKSTKSKKLQKSKV